MPIRKPPQTAPWAQALATEATKPVFPRLPPGVRPYLLAGTLFAAISGLLSIGDAALLHDGLPWTLVSVLVIVAAANLWGTRPAVLVLALSALYGAVVVPHLAPPPSSDHPVPWRVLANRTIVFALCGAATIRLTHRARQMQEQAERRREVVTALQSMILPDMLAEAPGYDRCGLYRPARHEEEVGGDFYDFYPIEAGLYGLFIGDVMGKGKEAAASTALLRYSVRALTSTGNRPAQILSQINTMLEQQGVQFGTATLFLGILDTHSGFLRYANAGHEPPMLKRAGGREEVLDATGPVLGIGLGVDYEERAVVLAPQDALLLLTDGVTEARDAQGKFLDTEGAWQLFRSALHASSAQKMLAALDTALTAFLGAGPRDDIAMLLLQQTSRLSPPPRLIHADGSSAVHTFVLSGGSPSEDTVSEVKND